MSIAFHKFFQKNVEKRENLQLLFFGKEFPRLFDRIFLGLTDILFNRPVFSF